MVHGNRSFPVQYCHKEKSLGVCLLQYTSSNIRLKVSINNLLNIVWYVYVIKDIHFFSTSFIPHVTCSFNFYCFNPNYVIDEAHLERAVQKL